MEYKTERGVIIASNPLSWIGSMDYLVKEHYTNHLHDVYIGINTSDEIRQFKLEHPETKTILYNLEHKYPQVKPGVVSNCNEYWSKYFRHLMLYIDEVWDFNIENYEYFRDIGYGEKFRFVPLRYTTYFEQFHIDHEPRYDFEFEATFDSYMRLRTLNELAIPIKIKDSGKEVRVNYKICNVEDHKVKYLEKLDGRFGFDLPHYDTPETINCYRIYECLCLNRQPIVFDPYQITSKEYFGDLPIYISEISTKIMYIITRQEPRMDVAERYKEMTFSDEAFEEYRHRIVKEFSERTSTEIPLSVLQPLY